MKNGIGPLLTLAGVLAILNGCAGASILSGSGGTMARVQGRFDTWLETCEMQDTDADFVNMMESGNCTGKQANGLLSWVNCLEDEGCEGREACSVELDDAGLDEDCELTEAAEFGSE